MGVHINIIDKQNKIWLYINNNKIGFKNILEVGEIV